MAALAQVFGIRPWEIDLLAVDDYATLCRQIDRMRFEEE